MGEEIGISDEKAVIVTKHKSKLKIELLASDIIYISNTGRHTHIVSVNHDFIAREIFSHVKQQIEGCKADFAMTHQSYYVNLNYVTNYTKDTVIMNNGGKVYNAILTRRRYREFEKLFFYAQGIKKAAKLHCDK